MARLNEPVAAPPEEIETLKRKFLRQNREIAKVNSTQAIRIRALENEVSRLLTDNLSSRGHIIRLERELESNRSRHQHVDDLRSQMEEKLAELGALFKGFDGRPSPKKRKSLPPKENNRMIRSSPVRSPGTKDWKNHSALGEPLPGQEGRFPPSLPAIVENKYYPRKTLEQDELAALKEAADTTDSPELEPPPVSSFIDEDPVKIDFPARTPIPEDEAPRKSATTTTHTTAMLEQRRKRRESVGITDIRRLSGEEPMMHEVTPDSLKVGAKRKISVRDGEERPVSSQVSPDDFIFTRKSIEEAPVPTAHPEQENALIRLPREVAPVKTTSRDRPKSTTTNTNGRRALAPKPSNDDVVNSPRKKTKTPIPTLDEISLAKKDLAKSAALLERPQSRARKTENIPPKTTQRPAVSKTVIPDPEPVRETEVVPEPEPETPAIEDVISPRFSEPEARPPTRDTPPPVDLGTEGTTEHSRPGRRIRSSVSYAEPNLRDKMRRPTKELVDAVAHKTYIKIEDGESSTNSDAKSSSKPVYIKSEPEDDDAWKREAQSIPKADPPSPLSGKAPILPEDPFTSRNDTNETRHKPPFPSTSTKDSDSTSNRRNRPEKTSEPPKSSKPSAATTFSSSRHFRNPAITNIDKNIPKLDIYDFPDPTETPDSVDPNEKIRKFVREEEEAAAAKSKNLRSSSSSGDRNDTNKGGPSAAALMRKNSSSKRNSALPLQMQTESSAGEESEVEGAGVGVRKGRGFVGTRRRSVATFSENSALASSSSVTDFTRGGAGSSRRGGGGKEVAAASVLEDGGARQERINARRRSMVL